MRRSEVFHVARAAADVAGVRRVLILGSQAIHGSFDVEELPPEVVRSIEADVVILDDPVGDAASRVDGAIGFMSPFARQFTYHADGMTLDEASLPDGWEGRVVKLKTDDAAGEVTDVYFPEVHDLALAKLAADRPHDHRFVEALWHADLLDGVTLSRRAAAMSAEPAAKRQRLERLVALLRENGSLTGRN
ncbi:MAG: hypothetical protein KY469_09840 [Actinobacteria bacterium]|nr:hypothetical protein [Actinomycetota bacterium]